MSSQETKGTEAHGRLVEILVELRRAAGSPSLRRIHQWIKDGDYVALPSHESVRKALNGTRVPRWETVEAMVSVLAKASRPPRDPQEEADRALPVWRAIREGESGFYQSAREFVLANSWGGDDGKWTPELIAGITANPIYAIQIDETLTYGREPLMSEEQWVEVGVRTIEEYGAEFFLHALLRTLKGDYVGAERGVPFGYMNPDQEAAETLEMFDYVRQEILRRLAIEPNLLSRSVAKFHSDANVSDVERADVLQAESDTSLLREAMVASPETWKEISEEAHMLIFSYLVQEVAPVGRPGHPPNQRFKITWRIPEPSR